MYAVVRTGGKQYRVAKDSVLKVESLVGDVGSPATTGGPARTHRRPSRS